MKKQALVAFTILGVVMYAQTRTLKTDADKMSYAIGINLSESFKRTGVENELNLNVLKQGIEDGIKNKELLLSLDSANVFIAKYLENKRGKLLSNNLEKAKKFLEENKKKKGIKVTASGLQYEIISKGKGKEMPKSTDLVSVNYEGKKLNGEIFDSSIKNNERKPVEFPLNQVIKGWTEGLQLMPKGAKYKFYISPELAYGEAGAGIEIEPNEVLVFDVELIDFKSASKKETPK